MKIKKNNIVWMFIFCSQFIRAEEFLYPVASCIKDGQQHVYLLYQKSVRHIELWVWDPITTIVNKALLSSYTPAGLRILPDQSGFSFIDNGRIKIKQFAKRSPKSLELYEPIYEIGVVEWIDPTQCYFSAKEGEFTRERTSIFNMNIRGDLTKVMGSHECDCLYPQKVDDQLFFIERSFEKTVTQCSIPIYRSESIDRCAPAPAQTHFKIKQMKYPDIAHDQKTFNDTENFDKRVQDILANSSKSNAEKKAPDSKDTDLVLDWGSNDSLAFLRMVSQTEGFVIEHQSKIDKQDKTITLSYYHLLKQDNLWTTKHLFLFEIPLDLLLPESSSRLYESMLPLLPHHYKNDIYFVDCAKSKNAGALNVYIYHLVDGKKKQLSNAQEIGQHFFAPIMLENQLYYGGAITTDAETPPYMRINEDGCMCFELPKV